MIRESGTESDGKKCLTFSGVLVLTSFISVSSQQAVLIWLIFMSVKAEDLQIYNLETRCELFDGAVIGNPADISHIVEFNRLHYLKSESTTTKNEGWMALYITDYFSVEKVL